MYIFTRHQKEIYQSTCKFTFHHLWQKNTFMKNDKKTNKKMFNQIWTGTLQSPCILSRVPLAVFIALLLWQPLRNVAATLSAHCSADALEVSMVTRMASRDCEGQSEPINGTMLRDRRNKKTAIKITNHASCHFYSCFAKKCVFCVCLIFFPPCSLFTMVLLFMQVWMTVVSLWDVQRGENTNSPFPPFFTALTNF